jgi:hypothetical protein
VRYYSKKNHQCKVLILFYFIEYVTIA